MTFPFVSVIVPSYNRPHAIADCVAALRSSTYPRDRFEILVVDDGSPVPIASSLHDIQGHPRVTVLRECNAGPSAARNLGVSQARGEFLAFTDDDCRPAREWLQRLVEVAQAAPTGMIGGRTVNGLGGNLYSSLSQVIVEEAYSYLHGRKSELAFFASNNMLLSADQYRRIGGFDPAFRVSEDRDLCDRWTGLGLPLVYAPEAVVHHYHVLTLSTFWRQHSSYGRGARRFHQARKRRGGHRFRPDTGLYASVCRRILSDLPLRRSLRMLVLTGVWQIANLAGFLLEVASEASGRQTPAQDVIA
ncbi:hypothetical protein YTPLAS18_28120 [Nitrospira sp.]|nr:hypothetical protein YTPLAS18_28120 [Nitrospira sp.]